MRLTPPETKRTECVVETVSILNLTEEDRSDFGRRLRSLLEEYDSDVEDHITITPQGQP